MQRRHALVLSGIMIPLIALTGCSATGSGSDGSADPSSSSIAVDTVADLAKLVPADFKDTTLTVGVNADNPPLKYIDDSGQVTGFAVEQLVLAGKVLGVKVSLDQGSFDSLIPGVESGRYQVLASLADTEERQSSLRFVDYMKAGVSWITQPDSTLKITSRDDLCGHSISVLRGSGAQSEMEALAATCSSAGSGDLKVVAYPDTNAAMLAITSGEDELAMVDSPAAAYNAKQFPDRYRIAFTEYTNPLGIGFPTGETELADAFVAALKYLDSEGVYDQLAEKYGVDAKDLVRDFPINAAKKLAG